MALVTVAISMTFWFRDIVSEGIELYNLNIAKVIPSDNIKNTLIQYKNDNNTTVFKSDNDLGYYLAGLLEGVLAWQR